MFRRKKYNPNPYLITFHDDADGGPAHLLWMLKGFVCQFSKNGKEIVTGEIRDVSDETVTIGTYNEDTGLHDKSEVILNTFEDFTEVMYL